MKMKPEYIKYLIIGFVASGIILFSINQILFGNEILTIASILITAVFPFIIYYQKYRLDKAIEERFPDFLRDVSSNVKAGMTLPQAVIATKKTNYGLLDPYLDKMAVQIDWGVPFTKIMENFANGKTPVIKRTVSAIIEAIKGGGNITETLDSIGASIAEINTIRRERQGETYSQMLTGYVIFFVFLGVIVALQKFLIPSLSITGGAYVSTMMNYGIMFKQMIMIQGFFSGLVIGKMSEGRLISGLKHSIILVIIGYTVLALLI